MNIPAIAQISKLGVLKVELTEAGFKTLLEEIREVFSDKGDTLVEDKEDSKNLSIFGVEVFYIKLK